jgi:hypothetical protein
MSPINSAKNHAIQTFHFRPAGRKDEQTFIHTNPETGVVEVIAREQLKLPICVFHRNHFPKPVVPSKDHAPRPLRRVVASDPHSILWKHVMSTYHPDNRQHQHEMRMARQRLAGNRRSEGILQ